jgi:hypothetical protein
MLVNDPQTCSDHLMCPPALCQLYRAEDQFPGHFQLDERRRGA